MIFLRMIGLSQELPQGLLCVSYMNMIHIVDSMYIIIRLVEISTARSFSIAVVWCGTHDKDKDQERNYLTHGANMNLLHLAVTFMLADSTLRM